jgi:hypothetical protein
MGIRTITNFFVNWIAKDRKPSKFPMCDFEKIRYELRPCDVILIEGRSRVSDVIRMITQSAWTHSALYIGKLHDIEDPTIREIAKAHYNGPEKDHLLIEGMLGQGTVVTPLHAYKKDHIRICRPRGLTPTDAHEVIAYSVKKLGTDYDIRQIIDLLRFFFPWSIMPRRWRSYIFSRTAGRATRTVCSTVIAEAFSSVDFPILPYIQRTKHRKIELVHRNPRLFTPRDFDYSPYFEIIKYPFLEFDNASSYRKLPWNRDGLMSHDYENITQEVKGENSTD